MRAMETDKRIDVNVGQTITIRNHERLIPNQILEPAQTSAGQSVEPGVYQSYLPIRSGRVRDRARSVAQVDENIAVVNQEIAEILFDDLAFVPTRNQKITVTMLCIDIHNMPQHGLAADFNHRLGPGGSLLR